MGKRFAFMAAGVVCCTLCQHLLAQSQSTSPAGEDSERLVYVIPNNLSIEHQKALAPISTRTKFKFSAGDVFDWYAFVAAGVNAGVEQATRDHPQHGQGVAGSAKRYGADFADEATSEVLGDAVFPSLFHQDPRYFRMEHGGIWKRSWYALTRRGILRAPNKTPFPAKRKYCMSLEVFHHPNIGVQIPFTLLGKTVQRSIFRQTP